ncbi:hypothetical protein [Thalassobacillus hwangdonensis]|uniref:Lipoprotein n=1 Tax=Thalassobacillus hwangdonensis TaxID=546108 RepID=A0ABW3L680_9BACI
MKKALLFGLFAVLIISGCSQGEAQQKEPPKETALTIEPIDLNENEKKLLKHTIMNQLEFFSLDGTLNEADDLWFTIEIYENGKKTGMSGGSSGEIDHYFNEERLSFGYSTNSSNDSMTFTIGNDDGYFSSSAKVTVEGISTFGKAIDEKVDLEKDEPVHLAYWAGTDKNEMRNSVKPFLDSNIDKAYVLTVTLKEDKDEK